MPPRDDDDASQRRRDLAPETFERRAARFLKRLARRHPRLSLRLLALLGHARAERLRDRWTPRRHEVASLLGISDPRRIDRIRREVSANELRNHALRSLVKGRGLGPSIARLRVSGAEHVLEPHRAGVPVIAVGWHAGAHRGVPATLLKLDLPVTMATLGVEDPATPELSIRWLRVASQEGRALFLGRALADLAAGRIVVLLADGAGTHLHPAPFLTSSHSVARGVAVLARLSGARLVPITTRWVGTSSRVAAEVHPALPEPRANRADASSFDAEVVAAVAAFFEVWARAHPGALLRQWFSRASRGKPVADARPDEAAERRPRQPSP